MGKILNFLNIKVAIIILFFSSNLLGLNFDINSNSEIVGKVKTIISQPGDTAYKVARQYDVGTHELVEANFKVNLKQLKSGTPLLIPSEFILPEVREGIVLNLAELRVYYFHNDSNKVSTFPVGIGRVGWRTPVGETKITRKREHPSWRPPASIKRSALRKGKVLPDIMPPGPNNPLGDYAMNFSWPRYLMHGTNKPESVGLRSSSGCIRLYPEDIEELFSLVDLDTKVTIIHMPYKLGTIDDKLYLEAHDPLVEKYYGYNKASRKSILYDLITEAEYKYNYYSIDKKLIELEVNKTIGYPVKIN